MARPGRHLEGARTRERVLDAASHLIAHHGYAATSIARISRASGANPASIYWAFGSKEGLFAAVMERAAEAFFRELAEPATEHADGRAGEPHGESHDEPDPWRRLARLADAFEDGPEFLRLLLVLSLERRDGDPEILEAARRIRAHAAELLAEGYAKALDLDRPLERRRISETLARFTLMLFDGAFVASQIEPDTTDLRRTFELIARGVRATGERLVEEALTPPPPPPPPAVRP